MGVTLQECSQDFRKGFLDSCTQIWRPRPLINDQLFDRNQLSSLHLGGFFFTKQKIKHMRWRLRQRDKRFKRAQLCWPSITGKYAESGSQWGFPGNEETTKLRPCFEEGKPFHQNPSHFLCRRAGHETALHGLTVNILMIHHASTWIFK